MVISRKWGNNLFCFLWLLTERTYRQRQKVSGLLAYGESLFHTHQAFNKLMSIFVCLCTVHERHSYPPSEAVACAESALLCAPVPRVDVH